MRKWGWLVAFAALLGLAALLMSRGDRPSRPERALKAEFPRSPKPWEEERNQRRRTLTQPPPPSMRAEGVPHEKKDPLLVALPFETKTSAVVFELAALKESPLVQAWLDCLLARQAEVDDGERRSGRDEFKEKFGIDPFEDVDRVAFSSGRFAILSVTNGAANIARSGRERRAFGENGAIFEELEGPDGSSFVMATWGDELVLVGPDAKAIEAALARLEARRPERAPVIPDWSAYGDIYGVLSPEELAEMLPEEQGELAARLRAAVDRVDLHVDASEDVAIVADVNGSGKDDISDIARSLGATLSLARAAAEENGDEHLRELLDHATVRPSDGHFSLDIALPLDVLKAMGPCRERPDSPSPSAAPPAPPASPAAPSP
jgi:hypothetical protein